MFIVSLLKKIFGIIKNRGKTVTDSKAIAKRATELQQKSNKLYTSIKQDGLKRSDLQTLQKEGKPLLDEAKKLLADAKSIGSTSKKT